MEYWEGYMNWPVDKNWVCETCGEQIGMTWGLVHAQCRCNNCHTQYYMRDDDEERTILTIPKSIIKEEYKEPLKLAYAKYGRPIDKITIEEVQDFMEAIV